MKRYGIAEWYGRRLLELTPEERQGLAAIALGEDAPPLCPFQRKPCNKKGGVCSIQPYTERDGCVDEAVDEPVIVCPARFDEDRMLVKWLAEIVGFPRDAVLVAEEIPFMLGTTTRKPAGKIDLVIARKQHELKWYGLEIQSVYFSGRGMESDFEALRQSSRPRPPFPDSVRRPDWRSSSAKRLMPQLQIKGPTLRRWQSKIAVAVDRPFFAAIGGPSPDSQRELDLDAGDVIWLVPHLSGEYRLERGHWEVMTLEAAMDKLLAAKSMQRSEFEEILQNKLSPL